MIQKDRTRPLGGRVGCELIGSQTHSTYTRSHWRSQLIADRFCLSQSMAQTICSLWLGEATND